MCICGIHPPQVVNCKSFLVTQPSPSSRTISTTTTKNKLQHMSFCISSSSSSGSNHCEVVQSTALMPLSLLVVKSSIAHAGIDPNMLKNLPVEGDASGAAMRLRQLEADRIRPKDTQRNSIYGVKEWCQVL
jgi:hypothetical protein